MLGSRQQVIEGVRHAGFTETEGPLPLAAAARCRPLPEGSLWLHGSARTKRGSVPIFVLITDFFFVRAPDVYIFERPAWLSGWRSHLRVSDVTGSESLCYSDHERYQLLPHQPERAVLRVIEDTKETLERMADRELTKQDAIREFTRVWPSDYFNTFIDVEPDSREVECFTATEIDEAGEIRHWLVSREPSLLAKKLGLTGEIKRSARAVVYPHEDDLYLTENGYVKDLAQFHQWLKEVAPRTYARWHARLQAPKTYSSDLRAHFFRQSGQNVGILLDGKHGFHRVKAARNAKDFLRDNVYQGTQPISTFSAQRMDDEYLVRRNLERETPDLRGLVVVLIGCGAVGSFLGQAIVALGAGLSCGTKVGAIHLIDGDEMTSGNVGRHLLGPSSIGKAKAVALAAYLKAERPHLNVIPFKGRFQPEAIPFDNADLIIDATGYETFARFISALVRSTGWLSKRPRALCHAWIEGRGGVVRSFIQTDPLGPCYDCLWSYQPNSEAVPRHKAFKDIEAQKPIEDGYATMTPFAVSSPLAATALMVDTLIDWRRGKVALNFRSRVTETGDVSPAKATKLHKMADCPGCRH